MGNDTIAAIATPPGAGGVGVLRISGPLAKEIAVQYLHKNPTPRYAHFLHLRDADGSLIDQGLLLYFPNPASYTGEDVVELHTHGSPLVLDRLLRRCCEMGARPARAGEFSERAFLNGKLDLTQAEAIADLIASQSEAAARAALRSLSGEFSDRVAHLLRALIRVRVYIEAAIDFPDEDVEFLSAPQLLADLATLRESTTQLLHSTRQGARLRDGLHVVIVGRPNAGKSSLLNALAAQDRAIVTPHAGTTRDLLRESVNLGGILLTLVDTAGLRDSDDPVEAEGIRRARAELLCADVAVLVTEEQHAPADMALLEPLGAAAARVVIYNKIDIHNIPARSETRPGQISVWLSARSGEGLELLREELKKLAGVSESSEGGFSARTRHVLALEAVAAHLLIAEQRLLHAKAGELAAEELHQAQRALAELTGEFSSDDLLGEIFGSFCIGK